MDLFTLAAVLTLETAKFTSGIRAATNEGKNFANTLQNKVSAGTVALGNLMSSTVKSAAQGIKNLTTEALSITGDAEQALGGSEAVFGAWADDIQSKAQSAFKTAGLSAGDYLETANKMGSLFKGSGFVTTEAFDMSTQAMQRAADVASIMGVDVNAAMEAVAGMAKGNFTMMDNLGVAINDTTLGVYALEKGITKSTSKMTTAEKVGLAYQMFMERTATYAGNYAKENDTLNGSIQTLKGSFENLLSGQGTVDDFVDSVENAARVTIRNLGEIVPRLASGMWEAVKLGVPKIGGVLSDFWDNDAPDIATRGANFLIQSVNAVFGTNIPKIEKIDLPTSEEISATVSAWWSGERSVVEDLCNWTLKLFDLPTLDEASKAVSGWWDMTKANFESSLEWTVQMFGFPSTESAKTAIKEWWGPIQTWFENTFSWWTPTDVGTTTPTTIDYSNPDSYNSIDALSSYGAGVIWTKPELTDDAERNLQSELSAMDLRATVNLDVVMSVVRRTVSNVSAQIGDLVSRFGTVVGDMNRGYATGLNYVPYDDFPANLHEGEAILTRTEAAEWRKGSEQSSEGIDYERLASAMMAVFGGMSVQLDGQLVGTLVAPTVSKAIGQSAKARRYTG